MPQPASDAPAVTTTRSFGGAARFAVVVVLGVAFSIFLVYNEDPWAIGRFLVVVIAYLAATIFSIVWFAGTRARRRSSLILLVATMALMGGVYILSSGSGFPATNVINATSYSCTTITGTNSTSHLVQEIQSSCTESNYSIQNFPSALGYNLLAWVPLVGCILFSMPIWNGKGASRFDNLARLIGGSIPAAAILLNLVGIASTGLLNSQPVLHLPLNPYLAYGECDSMTATNGCVYVNQLFVLADYAFWLVVVILATMAMSEVLSDRQRAIASIRNPALYSLALAFVLVVGLAIVPVSIAGSGILAYPGNSFSFYPGNSFVRIPFVAGLTESLSGGYESSSPVDVYVLNSTQFLSFGGGGDYCSVASFKPLLVNDTQGSIATNVGSGSFNLIFCAPYQPYGPIIQVTITSPVKLSS